MNVPNAQNLHPVLFSNQRNQNLLESWLVLEWGQEKKKQDEAEPGSSC